MSGRFYDHSIYRLFFAGLIAFFLFILPGCSIKKFAINKLGDSLANSGATYASDDDPDFVGAALPFSLKLIESLLAESPEHRGLLLAATSGFTQYAYVWVQQSAEELEAEDLETSNAMKIRARNLYLRARDYGVRGLALKRSGFAALLRENPKAAVVRTTAKDVPLLYWTAVAWGSAISVSKNEPELVADQVIVEALIDRALALQPDFEHGAIHGFLITYESSRQGAGTDFELRSRKHFDEAVRLTGGKMASPYVSLAETVSVQKQNRMEFEQLLKRALEIDPDAHSEWRLNNLVMQRRARWLLSRTDELFLDSGATDSLLITPKGW